VGSNALVSVLHVPFTYFPDPIGGTEIYVEGLVNSLSKCGLRSVIAAPGVDESNYMWNGFAVHRFHRSDALDLVDQYGLGDRKASASFGRLLDQIAPDVVHLHARTPAISVWIVEETRQRGIPTVFTYHTPTVTCMRGTLMYMGKTLCDGRLNAGRCTACSLQGHGLPGLAAQLAASLPGRFSSVASLGARGRLRTALQMRMLTRETHNAVRRFLETVDHIVVIADWAADLLERNGVDPVKITMSRPAVTVPVSPVSPLPPSRSGRLQVAFLGRLHPDKGLHVLLHAMALIPDAPIQLDIYCMIDPGSDTKYLQLLRDLSARDSRVAWLTPISGEPVSTLQHYDLLAVPSLCFEAGPLVVLEAFAAGIPVVGSALGGIAELVTPDVDAVLVAPGVVSAWAHSFKVLAEAPELVDKLRSGVRPPRTMAEVGQDMCAIYRNLIGGRRPSRLGNPAHSAAQQ